MENRYSIVKVEGCNEERLTLCPNMPTCAYCLYGDTRKQLIKKVAQVLKKETGNDGVVISNRNFEEIKSLIWEDVAEKIIEFLGVTK